MSKVTATKVTALTQSVISGFSSIALSKFKQPGAESRPYGKDIIYL